MTAPLPALRGHREIRSQLLRSFREGSLNQSLLLHGPPGVGKQRLGLWLCQLLLCTDEGEPPCGRCVGCRQAERLEHPDLHWFFPLPRPDSTSPEKLRDRLEELRGEELQRRRATPLQPPSFEKAPAHFLASIRTVQQLAAVRPAVGSRKVFVIGDAELMVPQESSPEAANAFLKLLEEPPQGTTFVLTSSRPGALLPTIRSRLLSLRLGPLPDDEVREFLVAEGVATAVEAERIVGRARGSIGRALGLLGGAAGGSGERDRLAGRELLIAALAPDVVPRLAAAHDRRPAGARADLVGELDALVEWLRDLLAVASGAANQSSDPESLPILRRAVEQRRVTSEGTMRAIEHVTAARDLAQGNVNPQLIVADLLRSIRAELTVPRHAPKAGSR